MSDEKFPKLPNRENITMAQFNSLLGVFIHTANFLIATDPSKTEGGPLDGGVKSSVETTLIKLCNRLDSMLDDESRWGLAIHNSAEAALCGVYEQHAKMLTEQTKAYAEISSPHHRYKPQLVKMSDGSWLAFAGNPHDIDNALCGVGDSPAMALEAFDALFSGKMPEHLQGWLKAREQALSTGQKPPTVEEFNKSNEQTNKTSLDNAGSSNPKNPKSKRTNSRRNRSKDGTDPQIGGNGNSPS